MPRRCSGCRRGRRCWTPATSITACCCPSCYTAATNRAAQYSGDQRNVAIDARKRAGCERRRRNRCVISAIVSPLERHEAVAGHFLRARYVAPTPISQRPSRSCASIECRSATHAAADHRGRGGHAGCCCPFGMLVIKEPTRETVMRDRAGAGDALVSGVLHGLLCDNFAQLIIFDRSVPPLLCDGANRWNRQMLLERFCAVMVRNWTGALLTSTSISPRRWSTVSSERRAWVSCAPSMQMSIKPDRRHFAVL